MVCCVIFVIACNCDTRGANASFLTSCEIHGGQCVCYPGVGSRRCDACLPMYVNLTAGVGCTGLIWIIVMIMTMLIAEDSDCEDVDHDDDKDHTNDDKLDQ